MSEHNHEHVRMPQLTFKRPDQLDDLLIMQLLDLVGSGLAANGVAAAHVMQARQAIYHAIDHPSSHSWEGAYGIRIWKTGAEEPLSLWNLVIMYAGFTVQEHTPGVDWPTVPSGAMVFWALAEYMGAQRWASSEF